MGEKTRIIKDKAAKYAKKGQVKRAIREYEELLKRKPDDVRIMHRLGELWAREKDKAKAVDFFLQAAEAYSREGFADRAMAVLKQAMAVDSKRLEVYLRLADEYHTREFDRDAVGLLLRAASFFEKEGMQDQELEVLKKARELAPGDVDCHMQLARFYVRLDRLDKARDEFLRAALELKTAERMDEFVAVAEKVVQLGEVGVEFHLALAECYLEREEWEKVQKILVHPINVQSDDFRTLELSARAFVGMERPDQAAAVYKRMARVSRLKGNEWLANEAQQKLNEITKKMAPAPPEPPPQPPPIPSRRAKTKVDVPERPQVVDDMPDDEVEMVTGEIDEPDENTMMMAIGEILSEVGSARKAESELDEDLLEGLKEADFLIGQGLLDEARETLDSLIETYSEHPEISTRLEEIRHLSEIEEE